MTAQFRTSLPFALLIASILFAGCLDASGDGKGTTPDAGATGQAASTGMVHGVVVDEAIRPLAQALVALTKDEGLFASNATNTDGKFDFREVPAGVYVLSVELRGFAPSSTIVTVRAGSEDPPMVNLQMIAEPLSMPYVVAVQDRGYFEACAMYCGGYVDTILLVGVCDPYGVCVDPVSSDRYLFYHPNVDMPLPGWIQTELFWTPSSSQFPNLFLAHNYHTDGPPTRGSFGTADQHQTASGPSPLMLATTPDMILAEANQTPPDTGLGFDPTKWGLSLFVQPASDETSGQQVIFQQEYTAITHYFYNAQPPMGWRFSDNQEVLMEPWP